MDPQYTSKLLEVVRSSAPKTEDAADLSASLHAAYSAVIQGDYAAFRALVTDDVEPNVHGFPPMDGKWRGCDQVIEAMRKNFALVASQKPEVEQIITQGNSVAVLLHESGVLKADGRSYSVRCVQWFNFADGKINKIDEILAEC